MIGTTGRDKWGREWRLVGYVPHRTRDGRDIQLAVWETECMTCSGVLRAKTPEKLRQLTRTHSVEVKRCPECRSSGQKDNPEDLL